MGTLTLAFEPEDRLRLISAPERDLLAWLLSKPGLQEVQTVRAQITLSVVHEIEPFRYLEFLTSARAPLLDTIENGVYVNAFAQMTETQGVEVLLHILSRRIESLEFSFSPQLNMQRLPQVSRWQYL